jgi:Tol biopolymer transport system component/DNA-binding winged helix-turn-helix (wHTH) protein
MGTENFRYYEFDEYKIDARRRILFKNGERVPLSSRIFDLLLVLVQNEGRILEHDELLDKVWEGMFVEQSNLKKSVSALRQILGERPDESLYIKTVPRRGYSFVADVRAISDTQNEPVFVKETREEIIVEEEIFGDDAGEKIIEVQPAATNLLPAETQTAKKSSGTQKTAIFAVCAVLIIGLVGFGIWKFTRRKVSAEDFKLENLKIQKLTTTGNVLQATISPDGKTVVYATYDSAGKQALWSKRIGQKNALQLIQPGDDFYNSVVISPDNNSVYYSATVGKTEDVLYRISISGGAPRKIAENMSSTATFSPDGKRLAFVRDTSDKMRRLMIVSAEDGSNETEIYAVSDNHKLIEPRWSPDGKKFAFVASDVTETGRVWGISEIPIGGGAIKQILPPQIGKVYAPNWLGDGSGLLYCAEPEGTRQTQIWRVGYGSGEVTRLTNDVSSYEDVNLSADANAIVTIQSEKTGDLWSMNWTMLQNTTRLTESQNFIGVFTALPDNRILGEYTENGQNGLEFVSADGSNAAPFFEQINGERTPSITNDGKSVLFVSRRSGTQEIWKSDLDGRNLQKLTDEKTFILYPKQTPDGREIYFSRYDGARWRIVKMPFGGGDISQIVPEFSLFYSFSPDGKTFAHSYLDEQKRRWFTAIRNIADNSIVKQFEIEPISFVDWTPDGKNLIYNASESFRDGGSLWLQPLDGSPPKQVLEAKEDRVYHAAWSFDKQKLYLSRGKTVSNIVLITKNNQ